MSSDAELLREFAQQRSEAAFAELVRRHVNLVYAVALRRTFGNRTLAEDAAQTVFVDLARKAGELSHHEALSGWLYMSARYAATQTLRGEIRRKAREEKALAMDSPTFSSTGDPDWDHLRGELDAVLDTLGEADRQAVVLRFYAAKPFGEIGAALRLSEDAARRRVDRALEKLRIHLARRGITSTVAALSAALASNAATVAPAGLGPVICGAVAAGTATGVGGIAAVGLFSIMNPAKITAVAACAVLARTAVLLTLLVIWYVQHGKLAELDMAISRADQESARSAATAREAEAYEQSLEAKVLPVLATMTLPSSKDIPFENAIESWITKVRLLSKYAEKNPAWHIRQMDYLNDDDWLNATRGKLESEADFRTALGSLRFFARKKTATAIGNAVKAAVNDGATLATPRDLLPYLPQNFDPTVLDQMEIKASIQSHGKKRIASSAYLIVDRPVSRWDPCFLFDANGKWAAKSNTPPEQHAIAKAIRDYIKTHGSPPKELADLKDYSGSQRFNEQNAEEVFGALTSRPDL